MPVFASDSFRRNLGERLTEAVAKEIESTTPYKVVHGDADSILWGRLIHDHKRPIALNEFNEPRDIEIGFLVQIDWRDRNGNSIGQFTSVPVPMSLLTFQQSINFLPESGQSMAVAQQEAVERLARQIVAQLEMPW